MNTSLDQLPTALANSRRALASSRLLAPEARAEAQQLLQRIDACLAALDRDLLTGIIGGTGVGKSTLINAIAGARISKESDRRPTTSAVVAYCHQSFRGDLPFAPEDLAPRPAGHDIAALRHVVILDLPDFDSFLTSHRDVVDRALPHLDLLLWLADPDKYGDWRFYTYLREQNRYRHNFIFIMNKLDRLAGVPQLQAQLLEDFTDKLAEHGVSQPTLFTLSAKLAFACRERGEPAPPDFAPLLEFVTHKLDNKFIAALRRANLDRVLESLEQTVTRGGQLRRAAEALAAARTGMETAWAEVQTAVDMDVVVPLLNSRFRTQVTSLLRRVKSSALRGPSGFCADMINRLLDAVLRRSPPELEGVMAELRNWPERASLRHLQGRLRDVQRHINRRFEEISGPGAGMPLTAGEEDPAVMELRARLALPVADQLLHDTRTPRSRPGWRFGQHVLPLLLLCACAYPYVQAPAGLPQLPPGVHLPLSDGLLMILAVYLTQGLLMLRSADRWATARIQAYEQQLREQAANVLDAAARQPAFEFLGQREQELNSLNLLLEAGAAVRNRLAKE